RECVEVARGDVRQEQGETRRMRGSRGQPPTLHGGEVLANDVDFRDRSPGTHQRLVQLARLLKWNALVERQLKPRRPAAADEEKNQVARRRSVQQLQRRPGGNEGILIGQGMAPGVV